MNIELKPIAESKVRQLGGDVCGVLVRKDGKLAAVDEHGRCTRLDAGVMGPVEPAGMSDREEFEKWYDETTNGNHGVAYYVDITGRYCHHDIEIAWQAWKAARAQGGQGAEPIGWVHKKHLRNLDKGQPVTVYHADTPVVFDSKVPVYTQPQRADQISLTRMCELLNGMMDGTEDKKYGLLEPWANTYRRLAERLSQPAVPEGFAEELRIALLEAWAGVDGQKRRIGHEWLDATKNRLLALLSTPTTPQADGWVRCEERLPTEADDDFNGCVWARFEDGDIELMETEEVEQTWDDDISITHWKPTGLKRPQPPKEGE